jgi:hypothetical protein
MNLRLPSDNFRAASDSSLIGAWAKVSASLDGLVHSPVALGAEELERRRTKFVCGHSRTAGNCKPSGIGLDGHEYTHCRICANISSARRRRLRREAGEK